MDQDRAVHLTKLTMLLLGHPTKSNIFNEMPSTDFMAVLACRTLTSYHLYIILNNMYLFGVFPSISRGSRGEGDVVNLRTNDDYSPGMAKELHNNLNWLKSVGVPLCYITRDGFEDLPYWDLTVIPEEVRCE